MQKRMNPEFDHDRLPAAIVYGDGVLLPIRHACQVLGLDPDEPLPPRQERLL
jgi:hypothetical protein